MTFKELNQQCQDQFLSELAKSVFSKILEDVAVDKMALELTRMVLGELVTLDLDINGHDYRISIQDRGLAMNNLPFGKG